jgi:hypothetical protein
MKLARRKLLLSAAVIPLWFVLIELGYRGWRMLSGRPYHAAEVRASFLSAESKFVEPIMVPDRTEAGMTRESAISLATLVPHPYTGVESLVAFDTFNNDANFCRAGRDPNEYVVILLGGSVANQFCPEGTDILRKLLAADPRFHGKRISVLNFARAGFKEPQQLTTAAWLFSMDFHPDAVINLDGYNETALFTYNVKNGAHPVYPFFAQWGHVARTQHDDPKSFDAMLDIRAMQREGASVARRALSWHLYDSSVLGNLTLLRLIHIRSDMAHAMKAYTTSIAAEAKNAPILGPPHATDAESLDRMMVRCWVESSVSLHGMCAERGVFYLHVLQPTLHDQGSKPLTAQEIETGVLDPALVKGVHDGYPKLRSAGQELRARGVHFVDASSAFADITQPIYFDFCHFKGLGNRVLANKIAEAYLQELPAGGARSANGASK